MDAQSFIFINFIFIFHVIETLTQSEITYFSAMDIRLDNGTELVAAVFLPISGWWCWC